MTLNERNLGRRDDNELALSNHASFGDFVTQPGHHEVHRVHHSTHYFPLGLGFKFSIQSLSACSSDDDDQTSLLNHTFLPMMKTENP